MQISLNLETENDTKKLAKLLSQIIGVGDVICLKGDLGSGKTFFARSLIQHLANEDIEVASPTFNLVLVYNTPNFPIWHYDLYRLENKEEIWELGIEDAFYEAVTIIEWPEIIADYLPTDYLEIIFSLNPKSAHSRSVTIIDSTTWESRVKNLEILQY